MNRKILFSSLMLGIGFIAGSITCNAYSPTVDALNVATADIFKFSIPIVILIIAGVTIFILGRKKPN